MHRKCFYLLLLAVATLLVLGIIMLSSTSAFAQDTHGDPVYFVKRQGLWMCAGFVLAVCAAMIDYHFWQRTWWMWFGASLLLLALCFVPHIGMRVNGSFRWINFRVIAFQPSELGKLAAIAFLAYWFSRYANESRQFLRGFVIPLLVIGVMMGLIAREVDLGTTALVGGTTFLVMFIAGSSLLHIGLLAFSGVGGILYAAMHIKERHGRLMAFLDPEKYKQGVGLQQYQALIAFGSGGIEGHGLGNGTQKMMYVPFAHTDFILPMIGEELGLRYTLLIVFCYIVLIVCGTVIAIRSRDRFGMLLGCGIVSMISLQAAVNIGVTTSLLPNKGLPLPYISYGGSNLVFCLLGVGILANIYRQGIGDTGDRTTARLQARVTPRI